MRRIVVTDNSLIIFRIFICFAILLIVKCTEHKVMTRIESKD